MSLEETLQQKTLELNNLQVQFDEFVESSKEIELELESELKEWQNKSSELSKKISNYEEKINLINEKNNKLTIEYNKITSELNKTKEQLDNITEINRKLESQNDELLEKNRILETSEEDFKYKLQTLEEELYFTQQDLNELKQLKVLTETRLKEELTELQSELSKYDSDIKPDRENDSSNSSNNNDSLNKYKLLQDQFNELQIQFNDNETNLIELGEELEKTQEELLNKANIIDELKSQLTNEKSFYDSKILLLQKEIEDKNIEIANLLSCIENYKQQNEINSKIIISLENSINNSYIPDNEKYIKQINELNNEITNLKLQNNTNNNILSIEPTPAPVPTTSTLQNPSMLLEPLKRRNSISKKISSPSSLPERKLTSQSSIKKSELKTSRLINDIDGALLDEEIDNTNPDLLLLESNVTSVRKDIKAAILTKDIEVMRSELIKQMKRYDDLRKGNAKLLQNLLLMKGNIQVCCRTRAPIEQDGDSKVCIDVVDSTELVCYDRRSEQWKSFTFDTVWPPDATQADVFADIEPLVLSVVDGYNACIFAYGQTGSGKTYTMNGYGKEYGVSYRTLHKIFELLESKKAKAIEQQKLSESKSMNSIYRNSNGELENDLSTENKPEEDDEVDGLFWYSVEVSMMEIYNEQVNDLLVDSPTNLKSTYNGATNPLPGSNLDIRQSTDNSVYVAGLKQVTVDSLQDVMEVFAKGSANRATTSTNLNERSSRSHLILSVTVTTKSGDSPGVKAKLNLVDLAGSERVSKSGVTGLAMKEAQHINKSLSSLGDVLEALDQKSKHIPYRNSKLTFLLQDSLSGSSRTMMIVTVCPTETHCDETLFTLQFATRVRHINLGQTKKQTITKNLEDSIKLYKNEIKELKKSKLISDEQINELKRENKKLLDKISNFNDTKLKSFDEIKKSYDSTNNLLTNKVNDLTNKLNDEKETRLKLVNDNDTITKTNKKLQDNQKDILREKERLLNILKQKDYDIEVLKTQLQQQTSINVANNLNITKLNNVSNINNRFSTNKRHIPKDINFGVESAIIDPLDNVTSDNIIIDDELGTKLSLDDINSSMDEKLINKSSNKSNLRVPRKRLPLSGNLPAVNLSNLSGTSSIRNTRPNSVERSKVSRISLLKSPSNQDLVSDPGIVSSTIHSRISTNGNNNSSRKTLDLTSNESKTSSNIPKLTIANRSKDALLKHQERMEKIREQKALIDARNKADL